MTVLASDIAWLRKLIAEPTQTNYTDADLSSRIELSACTDMYGRDIDDLNWIATYNIYAVAAAIWLEKASVVSDEFDFNADGGAFQRSQKQAMALRMASFYEGRSKALSKGFKSHPETNLNDTGWTEYPYKDDIDDFEEALT